MANKVFQILEDRSALYNGNDIVTNGATIEPGLLVLLDDGGNTVSLAAASGSAPWGVAYGTRDLVYAPTTRTFADGEQVVVVNGHFNALVSADFFSSGSIPSELTGLDNIYAAADGKLHWAGANKVGRFLEQKAVTDPTDGTGTTNTVAKIEFNFVP